MNPKGVSPGEAAFVRTGRGNDTAVANRQTVCKVASAAEEEHERLTGAKRLQGLEDERRYASRLSMKGSCRQLWAARGHSQHAKCAARVKVPTTPRAGRASQAAPLKQHIVAATKGSGEAFMCAHTEVRTKKLTVLCTTSLCAQPYSLTNPILVAPIHASINQNEM